jgi:hypothetical protein
MRIAGRRDNALTFDKDKSKFKAARRVSLFETHAVRMRRPSPSFVRIEAL